MSEPAPWIGGKVREVLDPYTKELHHHAIEDAAGVLWSGPEIDEEVKRLTAPSAGSPSPAATHRPHTTSETGR